ncbi:VanZ family protein [Paucilactobacillus kaifaensis]|uniref:VanZ family protein n=1 Tax=Paucilactobacillus kaifaensis TaxID=2559921 RepID=UPI0010F6DA30|nr:VanZ family protein [Paucilactobacillus kaifaensis]
MKVWVPFIIISIILVIFLIKIIQRKQDTLWQKVTLLTAWIYLYFICRICFAPAPFSFSPTHEIHYFLIHGIILNLVPFQAMDTAFWLNVVMTIPAGIYYALIWHPQTMKSIFLFGLFTGLTLETTQFIINWFVQLGRWVEIDDLITNAVGVWIGIIIIWLFNKTPVKQLIEKLKVTF